MLIEGKAADAHALDVGLIRTFIQEAGGGDPSGNASTRRGVEPPRSTTKEVDNERPLL